MSHIVTAVAGQSNIQLPSGAVINGSGTKKPDGTTRGSNESATISDEQFAAIPSGYFGVYITDGGVPTTSGDQVKTQAVDVANVAALTSSQNATANGSDAGTTQTLANALKVSYNALQVDEVTLRTTLNSLLTNLRGSGKPMA